MSEKVTVEETQLPEKLEKVYKACMAGSTYNDKSPEEKEKICRATAVKVTGLNWVHHKKSAEDEAVVEEEYIVPYEMSIDDVELSEDKFILKGTGITSDHIEKELLEKYYKKKIGTKLLFEHLHPVKGVEIDGKIRHFPVFGEVTKSELVPFPNGVLVNKIEAEVFGFSQAHQNLRNLIKEKKEKKESIGFSDHFFTYRNKEGKPLHVHWEEESVTSTPACSQCQIDSIEEKQMSQIEETNLTETETELTPEAMKATIVEMNEIILSQKAKIEELEKLHTEITNKVSVAETELSTLKIEKETNLKAFSTKEDELKVIQEKLSLTEAENIFLKEKKPLLDQLEKLLGGKYKNNEDLKKHYIAMTKEQLDFEVKRLSAEEIAAKQTPAPPTDNEIQPADLPSDEKKFEELFPDFETTIKREKRKI